MIYSNVKPLVFEKVGNGSVRYHFNIQSEEIVENMGDMEDPITTTRWKADEIIVFEPLSVNKFIKAIIDYKYGNGKEEKLINEYNSAVLDLYDKNTKEEKINAYKAFLNDRIALKEQVENDYWSHINSL